MSSPEDHPRPQLNTFNLAVDLPDGFPFTAESAIRRFAEPVTMASVVTIAGMDVAHPKIGLGVRDHSDFQERPWKRAIFTGDALLQLVFGNTKEATDVARNIQHIHSHINGGTEPEDYDANDGDLQRWVLATGFHGVETAYSRWVKPLKQNERQDLYSDLKTFGQFFGIPKNLIPENVSEHDDYMNEMLDGDLLGSTKESREMVRKVFTFRHRSIPLPLAHLIQAVSRTGLDPRFQERFDLRPSTRDKVLAAAFDKQVRVIYPRIPQQIRRGGVPAYLAARRIGLKAYNAVSHSKPESA